MPKTYAAKEFNIPELESALSKEKDIKIYRRLHSLLLRAQGKKNKEISTITKFHPAYISQLVSKYINSGLNEVLSDNRTGNNGKLTPEEEKALLEPFLLEAESGRMLVVDDIRKAYEQKTGEISAPATIYYLLHRNGWRKVMPRSKHPKKANEQAISAYKKNQVQD